MDKPMSNIFFRMMALEFKMRDRKRPPSVILKETGMKSGHYVLDYGAGPGGFAIAAAEIVGPEGIVYAADMHPLSIKMIQTAAKKNNLNNIRTILTDGSTGLEDKSIDVVLIYSTYHDLANPEAVMKELHRILKSQGVLSVGDRHLTHDEIMSKIPSGGLFEFSRQGKYTYSFVKRD